jgi:hypothetical protein
MRFMTVYRPADRASLESGKPPTAEQIAKMGQLIGEMAQAGVLLAADGLLPSRTGALVRLSRDKITVTDGPFTEAKELIGGFAILEVKSRAEAIMWAEKFLRVAGDGESEIREMYPRAAFPPA